jgi:hypothetical protein
MAKTWGSQPIMQNVGTIAQVVTNNATSFTYTTIFATNTHGDIFQFQAGTQTKIFTGNGTAPSKLAHDGTRLYAAFNGNVFTDTSGIYIYRLGAGANPWMPVQVNDLDLQDLIGANGYLYSIFAAGILRMAGGSNTWEKIGGPGRKFACNNQTVFGIGGPNDHVFQCLAANSWKDIRSTTGDIVARGNMMCAINKQSGDILSGDIFQFASNSWTKIGGPGKMFAIDDRGQLYGLTPDGSRIFQFTGQPDNWTVVGPTPAGKIFAGASVLCATSPDNAALWCFRDA